MLSTFSLCENTAGGIDLSFFPEIGFPQAFGGLILPLVAHAGDDQYNDGDNVRQHLIQLLGGEGAGGKEHIQNV